MTLAVTGRGARVCESRSVGSKNEVTSAKNQPSENAPHRARGNKAPHGCGSPRQEEHKWDAKKDFIGEKGPAGLPIEKERVRMIGLLWVPLDT